MGYITVITAFWILAYTMNIACLSRKTVFSSLYKLIFSTKTKRQTRGQFHDMLKPPKLLQFFFFFLAVRSRRKEAFRQEFSLSIPHFPNFVVFIWSKEQQELILSHLYFLFFPNCSGSWANSLNTILGLGVGWVTNVCRWYSYVKTVSTFINQKIRTGVADHVYTTFLLVETYLALWAGHFASVF